MRRLKFHTLAARSGEGVRSKKRSLRKNIHVDKRGAGGLYRYLHTIQCWRIVYGFDVNGMHLLEPHGLPDARDGRVPDAFGLQHLLAARRFALIGIIGNGNGNFVFAGSHKIGDIKGERAVAARMLKKAVLDRYRTVVVHRAEMQQRALFGIVVLNGKAAGIPDLLLGQNGLLYPRERAFGRKGHQDLLLRLRCLPAPADTALPRAVQILPGLANKLRAGIFIQGDLSDREGRGQNRHQYSTAILFCSVPIFAQNRPGSCKRMIPDKATAGGPK